MSERPPTSRRPAPERSRVAANRRQGSRSARLPATPGEVSEEQDEVVELPDYENDSTDSAPVRHFLHDLWSDIRVRIVLAILAFGLFVFFAGPPAYRAVKVFRAKQLLAQCEKASAEGNLTKAVSLMRQAVLMAPSNEEVFRKVRLFNAAMGDPSALNSLQMVFTDGLAQPDELIVLAEQSFASGKSGFAREVLQKLDGQPGARKTILEMRLLDKEGNRQAAMDLARQALPLPVDADSDRVLLAAAEMVLKSDPAASRDILQPLSVKSSAEGLAALRLLAAQGLALGEMENSETLALALRNHPSSSPDDQLLAADLEIRRNPASKPAVLTRLGRERNDASEIDALAFARWLNRRFYHQEALDFIGRERAVSDPQWLLIYLDALAGQNRWNDVFSILDAETIVGLSDSIRLLFLARAASKSGDTDRADASWREMQLGLLYEKPEVISFIAAYAMRIGETEQALKAYTTLSRRKETALEGYLGMIKCWPRNSSALELLPVYRDFLETFPNLTEARTDLTYLQLLTDTGLDQAIPVAEKLLQANPVSLANLSVAALAALKGGDPARAEAIYEGKIIDWPASPLPWRAVRVAVLRANGKTTEATALLESIETAKLRPEEKRLLAP